MIGGESLVWVALCRCDWWGEPGLGEAVPLVESLVWAALCRCDWWGEPGLGERRAVGGEPGLGGAVPL